MKKMHSLYSLAWVVMGTEMVIHGMNYLSHSLLLKIWPITWHSQLELGLLILPQNNSSVFKLQINDESLGQENIFG